MNKALLTLFLLLGICSPSAGQQAATYIEVIGGGKFRFYYNEQYFLVDKDCEFLSRIRTSGLTAEKKFTGDFTDQDVNGATILTGRYEDGKKNGTFRAFYPGGFLRWQGDFRDDRPQGTWNYYHPDGTPSMILEFTEEATYIRECWNEKGKPVVRDGNGSFLLRDYQFGYNPTGHEALLYRGRVRAGLPHGQWTVQYQFPGGATEPMGTVIFRDSVIAGVTPVRFAETEFFPNAEAFTSKTCSVDDQINFADYLRNHLNLKFDFSSFPPDGIPPVIEATLRVSSDGAAGDMTLNTPVGKAAESGLKELFFSIGYWVPSQKDGKVIDDTLTISMDILEGEDRTLSFGYPRITRAAGK